MLGIKVYEENVELLELFNIVHFEKTPERESVYKVAVGLVPAKWNWRSCICLDIKGVFRLGICPHQRRRR